MMCLVGGECKEKKPVFNTQSVLVNIVTRHSSLVTLTLLALALFVTSVTAQTPRWNYCRTAEIMQKILKDLRISPEKLRSRLEKLAPKRQAGFELPSIFYGGLGSGLYPQNGLIGTVRALHIMVRPLHPDVIPDPRHTVSYYNKLLFDERDPDSLSSFFRETSYGRFRLVGDSYGWLTVDVPTATSGQVTFIVDWIIALQPALNQLAKVVDFSRYDSDGDRLLDLVIMTVASDPDTRPPDGIPWADPSFGAFAVPQGLFRKFLDLDFFQLPPLARTSDGFYVDCAFFVHETLSVLPGHGVYAHEAGHHFGMPDLYNTYDPFQVDPGCWATMATGERFEAPGRPINPLRPGGFPAHYDPWNKLIWGWVRPIEVTGEAGTVTIPPYSEQPVAYRLWSHGSSTQDEYFLVVNRQLRGFDRFLPTSGLNIFHVDRSLLSDMFLNLINNVQRDREHKAIDLMDADGRSDMDFSAVLFQAFDWTTFGFAGWYRGNWGDDGDPFPGRMGRRRFGFFVLPDGSVERPSSISYSGFDSGVRVLDIHPLGDGSIQAKLSVAVQPQALFLSPREGDLVFTTRPLLQVQFTAPFIGSSDIDPVTITVLVNGQPMTIANFADVFDSGKQLLTFPLSDPLNPTEPLPSGSYTVGVQAKNRAGVTLATADVTFNIGRLQLPMPPLRLAMISFPYDFSLAPSGRDTPSYILGILTPRIARYGVLNPIGNVYGYWYFGEFVERFVPGRAYWVRLDSDTLLAIDAPDVDRSKPFRIANEHIWDLNAADVGWQQVGNPFSFPVDASAIRVQLPNGSVLSLGEAIRQRILLNTVYFWTGTDYFAVPIENWVMAPFAGYWIYKFRPCSLVIMPSPASRLHATTPSFFTRHPSLSIEIWGNDAELPYQLALKREGEPIPAPPATPGMTAWAYFLCTGHRGLGMKEVALPNRTRWNLVVQSSQPNSSVTLRWRGQTNLKGYQVFITDPQTHQTVSLKGSGELKVTTDENGTRLLVLQTRTVHELPLRIVNLQVTRLGKGGFIIRCALTSPAKVQGEIRTLTGRLVKVLPANDEMKTSVQLFWDGRGMEGQILPSNPLLLTVRAKDEQGRETQRVVVLR